MALINLKPEQLSGSPCATPNLFPHTSSRRPKTEAGWRQDEEKNETYRRRQTYM